MQQFDYSSELEKQNSRIAINLLLLLLLLNLVYWKYSPQPRQRGLLLSSLRRDLPQSKSSYSQRDFLLLHLLLLLLVALCQENYRRAKSQRQKKKLKSSRRDFLLLLRFLRECLMTSLPQTSWKDALQNERERRSEREEEFLVLEVFFSSVGREMERILWERFKGASEREREKNGFEDLPSETECVCRTELSQPCE